MSEQTKVLTIVDKSTRAMATASSNLTKVAAEMASLTTSVVALAEDIEFKQSQLDIMDKEIDNKQRDAAAELNLRIKEDEDTVLEELMANRKYAVISIDALSLLRNQLADAEADNKEELEKTVAKAVKNAQAKWNQEKVEIISQHAVDMAEHKADIKSLNSENDTLTTANSRLTKMLDDERQARVTTAQYHQPIINQQAPNGK